MAKSFAQQMADFVNGVGESSNTVVRVAGLNLFSKVVQRTPVAEGRARANWNADINTFDGSTTESTSEDVALSRIRDQASKMQLGDTFTLTNGLPYIKKLEFGSSRQAPNGMVGVTVEEFRRTVREAAARERS